MTYFEIGVLCRANKSGKIHNVMEWEGSFCDKWQVNYKSGKVCFYNHFEDLPETVKKYIGKCNRKEMMIIGKRTVYIHFIVAK